MHNYNSASGAKILAEQINEYYRQRRMNYRVHVEAVPLRKGGVYGVRSEQKITFWRGE